MKLSACQKLLSATNNLCLAGMLLNQMWLLVSLQCLMEFQGQPLGWSPHVVVGWGPEHIRG